MTRCIIWMNRSVLYLSTCILPFIIIGDDTLLVQKLLTDMAGAARSKKQVSYSAVKRLLVILLTTSLRRLRT